MPIAARLLAHAIRNIEPFSAHILKRPLRSYQLEPAREIISNIIALNGIETLIRFPRQSGKNELLAHVQAYILFLFQRAGGTFVHTAPTYDPQAETALQRVLDITAGNLFFRNLARRDNTLIMGNMRGIYVTGKERDQPIVGLTASRALFKDECQDLNQTYVERTFDPMTSDTNAPHIHTGTARHTATYLAQKRRQLQAMQAADNHPRVWIIDWRTVARENPAYGLSVQKQIALKGALHPVIQSEYENIENDQSGRLFDERRISLVQSGAHRLHTPARGAAYVATIDVGGTSVMGGTGAHDPTVCAIHRVTQGDDKLNSFTTTDYCVLRGANVMDDTPDRAKLCAFLDQWKPRRIVVDATGLGVGLASFLTKRYPHIVIAFVFTGKSKTDLINTFLSLIETSRYHHYTEEPNGKIDEDHLRFIQQMRQCEYEEHGQFKSWGVSASVSWTNPATGELEHLHDDHLLSNALIAVVADSDLAPRAVTTEHQHHERKRRNSNIVE